MKKTTFWKSLFLLCALIVGTSTSWGQTTVKDVLTASDFAATTTTYTDFSNVSETSGAVYAGQSAKDGSGNIQLRSKYSNSGIVSTSSGGTVKSVKITVGSGSNTIDVYGSNTAYSAASDLYGVNQGTKIGSLTETGTVNFPTETDYEYVGIRSNNGALYLSSVEIEWTTSGGGSTPTISANDVPIAYNATNGSIAYTINNPVDGGAITSAEVTSSNPSNWLTVSNTLTSPIGLTCEVNNTASERTATVTLTYTYDTDKTVTKEVTVTQAKPVITNNYTRATKITPGKHYILVGYKSSSSTYYAMGFQGSNNRSAVNITLSGDNNEKASIADDKGVYEVLIEGDPSTGYYTIYDEAYNNGDVYGGYLYAASGTTGTNNYMRTETNLDDNGNRTWIMSVNNNGVASIQAVNTDLTRRWMRFNDSSALFSCYETNSNQKDIYLYERDNDPNTQEATITLASACTDGTKYYGTYSCPFSFVVPADLTVSAVSVDDGKLVVENYTTGATVKANTGVMVSSTEAGDHNVVLSGAEGTEFSGNMLKATGTGDGISAADMEAAAPSCTYYRLTMHNGTQIGYWWGANSGAAFAVVANKAYLAVPAGQSAKISGFTFEDTTTGIANLNVNANENFDVNAPMYNLAGQRVNKSYKGVVIVNGKKMLNK